HRQRQEALAHYRKNQHLTSLCGRCRQMNFMSKKKYLLVTAATMVAMACGVKSQNQSERSSALVASETNSAEKNSDADKAGTISKDILVSEDSGSFGLKSVAKQIIMDADGLTAQFAAVFGSAYPRGTRWLADVKACYQSPHHQHQKEWTEI